MTQEATTQKSESRVRDQGLAAEVATTKAGNKKAFRGLFGLQLGPVRLSEVVLAIDCLIVRRRHAQAYTATSPKMLKLYRLDSES